MGTIYSDSHQEVVEVEWVEVHQNPACVADDFEKEAAKQCARKGPCSIANALDDLCNEQAHEDH